LGSAITKTRGILGRSETGKVVQSKLEWTLCFVVLADKTGIQEEDAQAEMIFVTDEDLVGEAHPPDEGFFFVLDNEGGGAQCDQKEHGITTTPSILRGAVLRSA
jgi:hypothetical protein